MSIKKTKQQQQKNPPPSLPNKTPLTYKKPAPKIKTTS